MAITSLLTKNMIEEYRERGGPYIKMVPWDFLNLNALMYPDREAIMDTWTEQPRRLTWEELLNKVNAVVAALVEQGLKKDDIVAVQLPNIIEQVIVRLASSKCRVICAFFQDNMRDKEIIGYFKLIKPKMVIIPATYRRFSYGEMYRRIQKEIPTIQSIFVIGKPVPKGMRPFSDLMGVKYSFRDLDRLKPRVTDFTMGPTGGTTGTPRLVLRSHMFWICSCGIQLNQHVGADHNDTFLALAPLAGGAGTMRAFMLPLVAGAKTILISNLADFDEDMALRLIQDEKATIISAVIPYGIRLMNSPRFYDYDLSSLRVFCGGGGIFPKEFQERLLDMGIIPQKTYGSFDGGAFAMSNLHDPKEVLVNRVGKIVPGAQIKVIDSSGNELPIGEEGELLTRQLYAGAYKDPEANKKEYKNGWWHSGDIGRIDNQGYVTITGRKKDMILRGARNIFPVVVEEALVKHPKVKEVAVIGMPDKELGERICAYVVTKESQKLTFDDMTSFLRNQEVPKYKFPERLEVVDYLPLSSGGKVSKRDLKTAITKKLKDEGKI